MASRVSSYMNLNPSSKVGNNTDPYSCASGSGKILTTAEVTMPSVPSEPNISRRRSIPTDSRGEQLDRSSVPAAVATLTSSTRSSILPYLFFFMPLALVAIQPPSVENSTLSGSCPIVTPYFFNSAMMCRPTAPAWMQASMLARSIQRIRFIRRISTETIERRSLGKHRNASVTFVPPPYGISVAPCFFRDFDQSRDLLLGLRIDDDVRNAAELGVLDRVHLLLRMAVAVAQADLAVGVDLGRRKQGLECSEELAGKNRFGNRGRVMRSVDLPGIEIHFEHFANPGQETGKLLAAQFITGSANDDVSVFADVEVGVAKSPDVEAFRFAFPWCGLRFRNNHRTVGCRRAGACFMECFRRTQTAILREKVPFAKACGNAEGEKVGGDIRALCWEGRRADETILVNR